RAARAARETPCALQQRRNPAPAVPSAPPNARNRGGRRRSPGAPSQHTAAPENPARVRRCPASRGTARWGWPRAVPAPASRARKCARPDGRPTGRGKARKISLNCRGETWVKLSLSIGCGRFFATLTFTSTRTPRRLRSEKIERNLQVAHAVVLRRRQPPAAHVDLYGRQQQRGHVQGPVARLAHGDVLGLAD